MTIKKRLFCSNILMIAVPAAIAALIGLVCLGLLWFILHGGGGMHLEDGEDFSRLGRSVTRQLQGCLADDPDTWTGRIGGLESMTESGALRIVVVRDGVPAYAAGEEQPGDSRLAQAADGVGETEVFVSAGERSIYRTSGEYQGGTWALYLFGTSQGRSGQWAESRACAGGHRGDFCGVSHRPDDQPLSHPVCGPQDRRAP